jgi:hypothetical protein
MAKLRLSEEQRMVAQSRTQVLTAFNRIPYALINKEIGDGAKGILDELTEIASYYTTYKKGVSFAVEGTNGDYVPAQLKIKLASNLVNKQARFLFAEAPDMIVEPKGDVGDATEDSKNALTVMNDLLKTVLDRNNFEDTLIKAAKDCFIGKRIAFLVNFNDEDGITISALPSTQFIYETKTGDSSVLTKFVCFIVIKDSRSLKDRMIFKKKYELDSNGNVWLEEQLYDGTGAMVEDVTRRQQILLDRIPAVVIINDGLTGDTFGESEIEKLTETEGWFSKLTNADIDAMRKNMNPIRYSIDIDSSSTKMFKAGPGAYWDAQSSSSGENAHPSIGIVESAMAYSQSLSTTLDRVKQAAYEQVDMPNIDIDSMQGTITSGKALKAIYWPLIVRCKEKMKTWGPALRKLISIIVDGSLVYSEIAADYVSDTLMPVAYEPKVEVNYPLPEDETDEKNMDLSEVDAGTMSRKAYMMKWRMLTDDEAEAELEQIETEKQMMDASHSAPSFSEVDVIEED